MNQSRFDFMDSDDEAVQAELKTLLRHQAERLANFSEVYDKAANNSIDLVAIRRLKFSARIAIDELKQDFEIK